MQFASATRDLQDEQLLEAKQKLEIIIICPTLSAVGESLPVANLLNAPL